MISTNACMESKLDLQEQTGSPEIPAMGYDQGLIEICNAWDHWPAVNEATIPMLAEHPCYDRTWGFEKEDRRWKESLALAIEKGRKKIPIRGRDRKKIITAIDDVSYRAYHVARVVQTHFENPTHGNYEDPFLETMFIMLTWRTRISDARNILCEMMNNFQGPIVIPEESSLPVLQRIIGKTGFIKKRPQMLIGLVEHFVERFPDGNASIMAKWDDDEIIDFLTSIPGIGKKSALCVMMYSLGRPRFPIDSHVGRVLKRTQMLRELVEIENDDNHKELQAKAEFAIPPSVRRALHAGLVSLGQTFCKPGRPSCGKCPIRSICLYFASRSREDAKRSKFNHIDLFCGAGGFSAGFSKEGFRTVLAVDNDPVACETFRINHPEMPHGNIQCEDLSHRQTKTIISMCREWREHLRQGQVDVLTAGIPCQGFSKAGYRSRPGIKYDMLNDPRNHLYKRVLLWIRDLQPKYVVIENVPEIRSAGNGKIRIINALCRAIRKLGYDVDYGIVNAFDHGTPQVRYRMILIGSHPSVLKVKIAQLQEYTRKGSTLGAAIGDLPSVNVGEGAWYHKHGERILTSHVPRFNNMEDLTIFASLRPGEHYEDFIKRRKDIMDERRRSGKYAIYGTRSFADKYCRLEPNKPSRTIVAHLNKDGNGYIHPFETRSITPREAMRIQGFADDYVFCGSATSQYTQLGNAIPPPLARDIARMLAESIQFSKNLK